MTKQDLSQLYYLRREIARDEDRLAELEAALDGLGAARVTGMPAGAPDADRTGLQVARILELRQIINAKLARARAEEVYLAGYIAGVQDSLIRQILTARYLDGKSWAGVAAAVGGMNTPDSVRKAHERWLMHHDNNS